MTMSINHSLSSDHGIPQYTCLITPLSAKEKEELRLRIEQKIAEKKPHE